MRWNLVLAWLFYIAAWTAQASGAVGSGKIMVQVDLTIVNDRSRGELLEERISKDTKEVVAFAQRLLDELSGDVQSDYWIQIRPARMLTLRKYSSWEFMTTQATYAEAFSEFALFSNKLQNDSHDTRRSVICLFSGFKFMDSEESGYTTLYSVNEGHPIVLNAASLSIPQVGTRLAILLARSIGIKFDDRAFPSDGPSSETMQCDDHPNTVMGLTSVHESDLSQLRWSVCSPLWVNTFFQGYPASLCGKNQKGDKCRVPARNVSGVLQQVRVFEEPPLAFVPSCGNGIVEGDEECDCVGKDCDPCCDLSTCKLTEHAECSIFDSCCTDQCKVKSKGTLCRGSKDEGCDLPEVCDGKSAFCPADTHVGSGTPCVEKGMAGTCFAGDCKLTPNNICWDNLLAPRCSIQDKEKENSSCGALHCEVTVSFSGSIAKVCSKSSIDIPDGTACGIDGEKVCKGYQCVSRDSFTALPPKHCYNGVKDEDETDVDCGGPACVACLEGAQCKEESDCVDPDGVPMECESSDNSSLDEQVCTKIPGRKRRGKPGVFFAEWGTGHFVIFSIFFMIIGLSCTLICWINVRKREEQQVAHGRIHPNQRQRGVQAHRDAGSRRQRAVIPDARRVQRMQSTLRALEGLNKLKSISAKQQGPLVYEKNQQPDELLKWKCKACDHVNNGLMVRCDSCGEEDPKLGRSIVHSNFDIDFASDSEEDEDQLQNHQPSNYSLDDGVKDWMKNSPQNDEN